MINLTKKHLTLIVATACFLVLFLPFVSFAAGPNFAQELVWAFVTTVTGWFLGIGGLILDYGINDFLIGFGKTFGDTGIGVAVDTTWAIIRDFVNMTFIFGLIYIGFKMILDSADSNTRRQLVMLIIAALLINFSLFISKAVVEVSNQFAIQILINGFGATENAEGQLEVNMAGSLQQKMGITSVFDGDGFAEDLKNVDENYAWGYIFGMGILFLVSGFVYAAGGILLIIRFAILNFYMVLSPALFLMWALPPLSGTLNKYWKQFLAKAFFAPIYILMLYFSFRILDGMQESGRFAANQMDWASTLGKGAKSIPEASESTIPFFILTCFFLIGSLVIAQKMGSEGADKAMSVGKSISKGAGKMTKRGAGAVTFGAGSRTLQATAGASSRALANNRSLQSWAAKSKLGAATLQTARYGADASFDPRNVGGFGKKTGLGTSKGGYDTRVKNKNKRDEEFLKSLENADMDNPENQARAKERAKEIENEEKQKERNATEQLNEHNESKDKTSVILNREIDQLGSNIAALTQELEKDKQDGSRTPQELETAAKRIETQKNRLVQKQATASLVSNKEARQKEIDDLKNKEVDPAMSPQQRAVFREQRQKAEADIAAIEQEMEEGVKQLQKNITEAQIAQQNAAKTASAEIKYANQIAFMQRREKEGATGFNPLAAESAENLKKKFGKDANEYAKKSKSSKDEENLLKALKKKMDDDSPAKETGGDDDKE